MSQSPTHQRICFAETYLLPICMGFGFQSTIGSHFSITRDFAVLLCQSTLAVSDTIYQSVMRSRASSQQESFSSSGTRFLFFPLPSSWLLGSSIGGGNRECQSPHHDFLRASRPIIITMVGSLNKLKVRRQRIDNFTKP